MNAPLPRSARVRRPRSMPSRIASVEDWQYEQAKAAWVAANPNATGREYELAIQAICRRLRY